MKLTHSGLLTFALLLNACNLEESATELFDPDPEFFNRPERLAEGEFAQVHVDTASDGSFAVLAIEDNSRMHIIPLGGAEPCVLESAQLILPVFVDTSDNVMTETVVPYYADIVVEAEDESAPRSLVQGANDYPWLDPLFDGALTGTLRFSDVRCRQLDVEVENTGAPYYLSDETSRRPSFLVEGRNGNLLTVDPWNQAFESLSDDGRILRVRRDDDSLLEVWTLEGGTITVRDGNLEATSEFGDRVSEVAFREPDIFAISGGELIRLRNDSFDEPETLDDDACSLDSIPSLDLKALLDVASPDDPLTYYSPCSERRLTALDMESDEPRRYDVDVDYVLYAAASAQGPWVAYLTDTESDQPWGTGWLALPDEEPEHLGDAVSHVFPLFEADTSILFGQNRFADLASALVIDDFNGTSGTLRHWDDGIFVASYDVEDVNVLGALFVSRVPPLFPVYEVRSTGEQLFVDDASGNLSPLDELTASPENTDFELGAGFLFSITDLEALTGTLYGLDRETRLAEDVRFIDIVVLESIDAAVFISDFDPDTERGTLRVFKQGFDEPAVFDRNVNSVTLFFTGYDNQSGILYTVSGGERAGIWFAATR